MTVENFGVENDAAAAEESKEEVTSMGDMTTVGEDGLKIDVTEDPKAPWSKDGELGTSMGDELTAGAINAEQPTMKLELNGEDQPTMPVEMDE